MHLANGPTGLSRPLPHHAVVKVDPFALPLTHVFVFVISRQVAAWPQSSKSSFFGLAGGSTRASMLPGRGAAGA